MLLGSAPCLCSASSWLWPRWHHLGEFGAGMASWSSALPACPPSQVFEHERREWCSWRNICNTSLGFSKPQLPGPVRRLLPAASFRRVLWIYFCRYKYNVRMGRSITNNIHDTAVNGARYKVWLPGALAQAGKDDFPVSLLLIADPWFPGCREWGKRRCTDCLGVCSAGRVGFSAG